MERTDDIAEVDENRPLSADALAVVASEGEKLRKMLSEGAYWPEPLFQL